MTFNLFSLFRYWKNRIFSSCSPTLAKISSFIFMYCAFTYKITPPRLNLFFTLLCWVSLHFAFCCIFFVHSLRCITFFTFLPFACKFLSFAKRWCQEESRLKHSAVQHSIKAFKRQCMTCMHNFFTTPPTLPPVIFLERDVKAWKSRRNFFIQLHCRMIEGSEKNVKNKSNFQRKI